MLLQWVWILWVWGGDLAAVICCIWAFWRGGPVERFGAAIISIGWILTVLFHMPNGGGPGSIVTVIDILAFGLFLALAIWSRRIWVFFAAACQINAVFSHFIHNIASFGIYGYATAAGLWGGWALLICLACGILGYQHSLKRRPLKPNRVTAGA